VTTVRRVVDVDYERLQSPALAVTRVDTTDPLAELREAGDEALAGLLAEFGLDVAPPEAPTVRPTCCRWCGGPIRVASTGRPRLFCSDAHRHRAWLAARAR
jgi:hypothetical protein